MAKVSIGLRGWRFEESDVFTDDGEIRPLETIPEEDRHRLLRLQIIMDRPCDACYLVHGDEEIRRCREPTVVYGEPLEEVVLCDEHERDFFYWYREAGGRHLRGTEEFQDAFYEWFDDGGRAPEGYGALEHVDTDPDDLPEPPSAEEVQARLAEATGGCEVDRIDVRELGGAEAVEGASDEVAGDEDESAGHEDGAADAGDTTAETSDEREAAASADEEAEEAVDAGDLDLGQDYPTR